MKGICRRRNTFKGKAGVRQSCLGHPKSGLCRIMLGPYANLHFIDKPLRFFLENFSSNTNPIPFTSYLHDITMWLLVHTVDTSISVKMRTAADMLY